MIASFLILLGIFTVIGLSSAIHSKKTKKDYLLAGRDISPWLVALSAVSTNNSGYMFIGQIGFTYIQGLSSIWLMIGWIAGDFLASLFIHKKLRLISEKYNLLTFGGIIAKWHGTDFRKIRILVGIITIIFLGTYAAAQFKAGSKALHVLFGWDYSVGAIIGSIIVFLYCIAGGIRASIWTDAAQSFVMILSMTLLLVVSLNELGGITAFWESLSQVSSTYLNVFPPNLKLAMPWGAIVFVFGWLTAGFGVVGQPHIMVRFMALDSPKNIFKVRLYYYTWYISFFILAIAIGLAARILLPEINEFDPELALPMLSSKMLPPVLIGLMLAGLFAATMSTADSQVLSCSAALTTDLIPPKYSRYWVTKLGTFLVTVIALIISLFGGKSVFNLVLIAWSILASAFSPILIVYAFGRKISELVLFLMITGSVLTCILWRFFDLSESLYEIAPGILAGLIIYFVSNRINLIKTKINHNKEKI